MKKLQNVLMIVAAVCMLSPAVFAGSQYGVSQLDLSSASSAKGMVIGRPAATNSFTSGGCSSLAGTRNAMVIIAVEGSAGNGSPITDLFAATAESRGTKIQSFQDIAGTCSEGGITYQQYTVHFQ